MALSISGNAQQGQLLQLRAQAEQAEQVARALRSAANSAQREAQRSQQNARLLQADAGVAEGDAQRARRNVSVLESSASLDPALSDAVSGVAADLLEARLSALPVKSAVVNTQGQITGTTVNIAV